MELWRFLQSIEDLLYELVAAIVLWPVTLFRLLAHPTATLAVVEQEQAKAPGERYDTMTSPAVFLVLTLLLVTRDINIASIRPFVRDLIGAGSGVRFGYGLLQLTVIPLGFSVAFMLIARARFSRSELRVRFAKQCYLVGTYFLSATAFDSLMRFNSDIGAIFGMFIVLPAHIWFFGVEATVLRAERKLNLVFALSCIFIVFIFSLLLFYPLSWLFFVS